MPATCVATKRAFQTVGKICFEKNICVHPGKDGLPVAVRIELSQFSDQGFYLLKRYPVRYDCKATEILCILAMYK